MFRLSDPEMSISHGDLDITLASSKAPLWRAQGWQVNKAGALHIAVFLPLADGGATQGENLAAPDDATSSELVAPKRGDLSVVHTPLSQLGGSALPRGPNTGWDQPSTGMWPRWA